MTVVNFPPAGWTKPKTLEDWPWDDKLGKPTDMTPCDSEPRDINGPIEVCKPCYVGEAPPPKKDVINPTHYQHKGVECIDITENMNFNLGNVVKYCYRCDLKGGVEDLRKAKWYLDREIKRRTKGEKPNDVEHYHGC